MNTEFQQTIRRLEGFMAERQWDRAEEELRSAYALQPQNPYLAAYAHRLASQLAPTGAGASRTAS